MGDAAVLRVTGVGTVSRDVRRFRKNPIRRADRYETVRVDQMVKVLPKESEREIQVQTLCVVKLQGCKNLSVYEGGREVRFVYLRTHG